MRPGGREDNQGRLSNAFLRGSGRLNGRERGEGRNHIGAGIVSNDRNALCSQVSSKEEAKRLLDDIGVRFVSEAEDADGIGGAGAMGENEFRESGNLSAIKAVGGFGKVGEST